MLERPNIDWTAVEKITQAEFLALYDEYENSESSFERENELHAIMCFAPWMMVRGKCVRRADPSMWTTSGPSGQDIDVLDTQHRLFDFFHPRRIWATGPLEHASVEDQALIQTLETLLDEGLVRASHVFIESEKYDPYASRVNKSQEWIRAHRDCDVHGHDTARGMRWSAYLGMQKLYPDDSIQIHRNLHFIPFCVLSEESRVAFIAGNNSPGALLRLVAFEGITTLGVVHFFDELGYLPNLDRNSARWSVLQLHFDEALLGRMATVFARS